MNYDRWESEASYLNTRAHTGPAVDILASNKTL